MFRFVLSGIEFKVGLVDVVYKEISGGKQPAFKKEIECFLKTIFLLIGTAETTLKAVAAAILNQSLKIWRPWMTMKENSKV
jgi:hypothetical protein